jgi:hypothetical protein
VPQAGSVNAFEGVSQDAAELNRQRDGLGAGVEQVGERRAGHHLHRDVGHWIGAAAQQPGHRRVGEPRQGGQLLTRRLLQQLAGADAAIYVAGPPGLAERSGADALAQRPGSDLLTDRAAAEGGGAIRHR